MSKLTIPSPKNLKKREAFLFAHPEYYKEGRLKSELSTIVATRADKNLRWARPVSSLAKQPTELEILNNKTSLFSKIFKKG